jgi:TonB family protein
MRKILIAALMVSGLWSTPGRTAEPLYLKPSTKWLLNYADESCRLARKFGEGDQQVTLFIDQLEPGDWFQIVLGGKLVKPRIGDQSRVDLKLRFGPIEITSNVEANIGTMSDLPALLISGAQRLVPLTEAEKAARQAAYESGVRPQKLPPIEPQQEKAVTFIEVSKGVRSDVILETGPMDKPMAALRECAWDTIRSWGLDVKQQKTLSREVAPTDPKKPWINGRDYPTNMLRGGYEGVVNFRLLIDAKGTATSCHIQTSTRPKEFDDAVCRIVMRRVRFNPALDANRDPVPSYYRQTINFRLEG